MQYSDAMMWCSAVLRCAYAWCWCSDAWWFEMQSDDAECRCMVLMQSWDVLMHGADDAEWWCRVMMHGAEWWYRVLICAYAWCWWCRVIMHGADAELRCSECSAEMDAEMLWWCSAWAEMQCMSWAEMQCMSWDAVHELSWGACDALRRGAPCGAPLSYAYEFRC